MSTNDAEVVDAFKDDFKFYKRRDRPVVDLSNVIDFRHPEKWTHRVQQLEAPLRAEAEFPGLVDPSKWSFFKLLPDKDSPAGDGIYFVQDIFTQSGWFGRKLPVLDRSLTSKT